jgi:hypothetical protein
MPVNTIAILLGLVFIFYICVRITLLTSNSPAPESRKASLRGEVQNLGLGIWQVQGYIDHLDGHDEIKKQAQTILDHAKTTKEEVEKALDAVTVTHQLNGLVIKLNEARYYVREARNMVLALTKSKHNDDDGF